MSARRSVWDRLSATVEAGIGRYLTVTQRLVFLLGVFVALLAGLFFFRSYVLVMGPLPTLAGFLVVALVAVVTSGVVSRSIVNPLRRTIEYCDAIGSGRYDTTIDVGAPDELGDVMRALDRMQARLRDNAATLRLLYSAIEHSPVSVLITDRAGTIQYVNPKFSAVTGYASAEVIGQNPRLLKSGKQSPAFYKDLWDTISSGREWRGEVLDRKKNGETYWERGSISPIFDPWGSLTNFVSVREDVTERKTAEAALERAERKYRDIVEQSVQGMYQTSPDGRFLSANLALARLFGCDGPEELLAGSCDGVATLFVDADRRAEFVRLMEARGLVSHFESRALRKDGRIIWAAQNARAVRDQTGQLQYYEGFVEDITALKEAEQLKSDFVSFVTHQLRTPLAGIKWMLELARDLDPPEETASYIGDAAESAERLIGLVNDLLDVSRIESGKVVADAHPTDLKALTEGVVNELRPLAQEKHQDVITVASECVPPVLVDSQLGRQIVLNLLSNAIKYTREGGTITIRVRPDGAGVEWSVQDTGIGIPAAEQRRLFEKFYRAENARTVDTEGTGLGLYLVRLILERSRGRVWCESEEGVGTTFHFTLPLADAAVSGVPA